MDYIHYYIKLKKKKKKKKIKKKKKDCKIKRKEIKGYIFIFKLIYKKNYYNINFK